MRQEEIGAADKELHAAAVKHGRIHGSIGIIAVNFHYGDRFIVVIGGRADLFEAVAPLAVVVNGIHERIIHILVKLQVVARTVDRLRVVVIHRMADGDDPVISGPVGDLFDPVLGQHIGTDPVHGDSRGGCFGADIVPEGRVVGGGAVAMFFDKGVVVRGSPHPVAAIAAGLREGDIVKERHEDRLAKVFGESPVAFVIGQGEEFLD